MSERTAELFEDVGTLRDRDLWLDLRSREPADPVRGWVPAYHFVMRLDDVEHPVGRIGFRVGDTYAIEHYAGHLGYEVAPPLPWEPPGRAVVQAASSARPTTRLHRALDHLQPRQLGVAPNVRAPRRRARGDCGRTEGQRCLRAGERTKVPVQAGAVSPVPQAVRVRRTG